MTPQNEPDKKEKEWRDNPQRQNPGKKDDMDEKSSEKSGGCGC